MVKKATVFLCDLIHTGQAGGGALPLGVGNIATYAYGILGEKISIQLFKYPEDLARTLDRNIPDVIAFSNYIWNERISYAFAAALKAREPAVMTAFGGPNYPLNQIEQKDYLLHRPAIDFYIHGEGEITFTQLLSQLIDHDFCVEEVKKYKPQGVHFIHQGVLIRGGTPQRLTSLDDIPSPFTSGLLDRFFDAQLIPLYQTVRGCPFQCTFCCMSLPIHNHLVWASHSKIKADLEYIAQKSHLIKTLNLADSNFGMYDHDIAVSHILAACKKRYQWPHYIFVATGKNRHHIVLECARILEGSIRFSASVQSTNDSVLRKIKRHNIPQEELMLIAKQAKSIDANSYSEIIIGLPGDSLKAYLQTLKDVIDNDLNYVVSYSLLLLTGTPLASKTNRRKYSMGTKWRVRPSSFGTYTVFNEVLPIVEIEEVCVANNTFSFQDYIACRKIAFIVSLFYNDGTYEEITNLLKTHHMSVFDWIVILYDDIEKSKGAFKNMYDEFVRETKEELWDSAADLTEYVIHHMDEYISGERGANLIYKYKSHSLLQCLAEMNTLAFEACKKLLDTKKVAVPDRFMKELGDISFMRKVDFLDVDKVIEAEFDYDVISFLRSDLPSMPSYKQIQKKNKMIFSHTAEQKKVITPLLEQYGVSPLGIRQLLSRTNVRNLFRRAAPLSAETSCATTSCMKNS